MANQMIVVVRNRSIFVPVAYFLATFLTLLNTTSVTIHDDGSDVILLKSSRMLN